MRSRRSSHSQAADVARRRLELLSAELAAIRSDPVDPPSHDVGTGSGEPPTPLLVPHPPLTAAPAAAAGPPGRHARRAGASRSGGWVEDRLPATLQGRVRVGPSQLTVVAVLVAAALGFLAWWSVRAADPGALVTTGAATPVTSEIAPLVSSPSGPSPPNPAPPGSPGAMASSGAGGSVGAVGPLGGDVVVDVAGKVRRPGIVRLPAGSRVVDALDAAGGARRGVDLTGLNLARLLVDGEQVLVGVRAVPGVAPSAAAAAPGAGGASTGAMVNINTAGADELDTLPGVGPVTAAAILQWRADHGAFSAVEELLEVSGIGDATLAEMAPFVTL